MKETACLPAEHHHKPAAHTIIIPCTSAAFAELSAEVLRAGRTLRFKAHGTSMQPLIRDGDTLQVQPVMAQPLRLGEVVLCKCGNGQVVVHRIIRKKDVKGRSCFLVQGDQASVPDGCIEMDDIYGKLFSIKRAGRQIRMQSASMRILNWTALWRKRYHLDQHWLSRSAGSALKRLPCLNKLLT